MNEMPPESYYRKPLSKPNRQQRIFQELDDDKPPFVILLVAYTVCAFVIAAMLLAIAMMLLAVIKLFQWVM